MYRTNQSKFYPRNRLRYADKPKMKKGLLKILFSNERETIKRYERDISVTSKIFKAWLKRSIKTYGHLSLEKCEMILELSFIRNNMGIHIETLEYMKIQGYSMIDKYYVNLIRLSFHTKNSSMAYVLGTISKIPSEMMGTEMYAVLFDFYYHIKNYEKLNEIFHTILEKGMPLFVRVCIKIISDCASKKPICKFINIEQILNVLMISDSSSICSIRPQIVVIYEEPKFAKEYKRYKRRMATVNNINRDEYENAVIEFCRETKDSVAEKYVRLRIEAHKLACEEEQEQEQENEIQKYIRVGKLAGKDTPTIFAEGVEFFTKNGRFDLLMDFAKAFKPL